MVALAPITNETPAWDVLNTFPKLHSRAREVKTGICTEALHSKSLGRVEIWLRISESCVGLESFTRDPIGFDGSPWSVYQYVFDNPHNWVDSDGQVAIPPSDVSGCIKKCGNNKSCGFRCQDCGRKLDDWFDRQKKKKDNGELDKILNRLPSCPCNIPNDPWKVPDKWFWDGACNPTGYFKDLGWHPGAKGCIRSADAGPYHTKPLQQCCYDGSGKLITSGSGAGTPDINDPGHQEDETIPFDCAHHLDSDNSKNWKNQGPHVQVFLTYRPPNNSDNCAANDPNLPPPKTPVK